MIHRSSSHATRGGTDSEGVAESANAWRVEVALAASTTLVAAIISRASGSGTLFAVLTVPLALPLLVILIQGTRAAAADAAFAAVAPALQGIVSLAGVSLVAATFLFPVVWND